MTRNDGLEIAVPQERPVRGVYAYRSGPRRGGIGCQGLPSGAASAESFSPREIGGVPVPVSFSGLAPNFAGLYQINIQVPEVVPSGAAVPLIFRIGNLTSSVTIAIE